MTNIRNERNDITTDSREIKRKIRKQYEQLHVNRLNILMKLMNFLKDTNSQSSFKNRLITLQIIICIIYINNLNCSQNFTTEVFIPDDLTSNSTIHLINK